MNSRTHLSGPRGEILALSQAERPARLHLQDLVALQGLEACAASPPRHAFQGPRRPSCHCTSKALRGHASQVRTYAPPRLEPMLPRPVAIDGPN
ncbi:hypothetical protein TIFTF001_039748 [Ficus carica]|uniref:Uncharacterized protein n=1 Tax=Ficus carica TaxID=3494 RepID=A0AA87YUT9_FICCA|nr:hypothetical protein TIFTF001_039748 [Ficus carica]